MAAEINGHNKELVPEVVVEKSKDGINGHDVEKQVVQGETEVLSRKLKNRHIQMIAIGGTIGTGLFLGSGGALSKTGPVGCLIAYIFIGTVIGSVMISLGEMATYIPIAGSFTSYASRFVDPTLGFAMGWIYWWSWAVTFALELEAAGLIIQYWRPDLNIGIWVGVFWIVFTAVNCLPVGFYGEIEAWFASIKVITIVGFMIFAICVNAGVGTQGYLGFKYWKDPGPFAPYLLESTGAKAKFVGFWATLIVAGFSYQGTELVGIAAGETENPRKTMPSAIRKTFIRILFLFCLTIFFIGILIPYDNEQLLSSNLDATASPLVIAAQLAGVKVLPSIINAVLLTAVLSAGNSDVYSGSRILLSLVNEGHCPKIIGKITWHGVPHYAVAVTAVWGLLGFLNLSTTATKVFNWLLNITAVAGFIAWACICLAHIRFMAALKARGQSRDTLPYKAPFQPYAAWYGLFWCVIIIITQGFTAFIPWDTTNFFVAYVSVILFAALWIGHKIVFRTKFVKPEEADLDSGRREVEAVEWEQAKPKPIWAKVFHWIG